MPLRSLHSGILTRSSRSPSCRWYYRTSEINVCFVDYLMNDHVETEFHTFQIFHEQKLWLCCKSMIAFDVLIDGWWIFNIHLFMNIQYSLVYEYSIFTCLWIFNIHLFMNIQYSLVYEYSIFTCLWIVDKILLGSVSSVPRTKVTSVNLTNDQWNLIVAVSFARRVY